VGRVLFFCWDMQTVGAWRWTCWLADLNTTVGGHARCDVFVILVCLGNVSGLGKCNSITGIGSMTNLQVGVLRYCSLGTGIGFVFSSHFGTMKLVLSDHDFLTAPPVNVIPEGI
jgi:hypothetical protein